MDWAPAGFVIGGRCTAPLPPTYPADAFQRAYDWRQSQCPHDMGTWRWEGAKPTPADAPGWLHIGCMIAWDGEKLRICWQPETDTVRVERPTARDMTITVPAPPPVPPAPIQFHATIRARERSTDVWVRLWPLSSRGREHLGYPSLR